MRNNLGMGNYIIFILFTFSTFKEKNFFPCEQNLSFEKSSAWKDFVVLEAKWKSQFL